jgi:hypothetical protein
MNFMARQLDGHDRYRWSRRDGDGENKSSGVAGDAGVERAVGIWSLEFRELSAFCGIESS